MGNVSWITIFQLAGNISLWSFANNVFAHSHKIMKCGKGELNSACLMTVRLMTLPNMERVKYVLSKLQYKVTAWVVMFTLYGLVG